MLVPVVQFVDDGMAQYAFTLAVDEDELLAPLRLVLFDRAAEDIQLVFQYIGRGHSGCRLQQLVCMEVYDNFVVIEYLLRRLPAFRFVTSGKLVRLPFKFFFGKTAWG